MKRTAFALAAFMALPAAAMAQGNVAAETVTDLNLRDAPGTYGSIIATMPYQADVFVNSCDASGWCFVNFEGIEGYASGEYLATDFEAERVYMTADVAPSYVPVETYTRPTTYVEPQWSVTPAGPTYYDTYYETYPDGYVMDSGVVDYVISNPVEPVYLNGEIARGVVYPSDAPIYTVPNTTYSYTYANGAPVIIDENNRVVEVVY